jgi:ADP-ribose pyrophosphatase YjhB (NUDIX family)
MTQLPPVCCVIVTNSNQEVLLIRRARDPHKNHWALISGIGYSKKGLSLEEGVTDEVEGDIGTPPFDVKRLFTVKDGKQDIVVFQASIDEDSVSLNPKFVKEYVWKSREDLSQAGDFAFNHREILDKYFSSFGR